MMLLAFLFILARISELSAASLRARSISREHLNTRDKALITDSDLGLVLNEFKYLCSSNKVDEALNFIQEHPGIGSENQSQSLMIAVVYDLEPVVAVLILMREANPLDVPVLIHFKGQPILTYAVGARKVKIVNELLKSRFVTEIDQNIIDTFEWNGHLNFIYKLLADQRTTSGEKASNENLPTFALIQSCRRGTFSFTPEMAQLESPEHLKMLMHCAVTHNKRNIIGLTLTEFHRRLCPTVQSRLCSKLVVLLNDVFGYAFGLGNYDFISDCLLFLQRKGILQNSPDVIYRFAQEAFARHLPYLSVALRAYASDRTLVSLVQLPELRHVILCQIIQGEYYHKKA